MSNSLEREYKWLASSGAMEACRQRLVSERLGDLVSVIGERRVVMFDMYYDRGDFTLLRAGRTVRLRYDTGSGEAELTIKLVSPDGHRDSRFLAREEVRIPLSPDRMAACACLRDLAETKCRKWMPSAEELQLQVVLRSARTKIDVVVPEKDTRIEASLDRVTWHRGGHIGAFCEIELELIAGGESDLVAVGSRLSKQPGLVASGTPKLQVALREAGVLED